MKRNYLFDMMMDRRGLSRSKTPPLCDSCSSSFEPDSYGNYKVTALVLNSSIWGLACPKCYKHYWPKMTHFSEAEAPQKAKDALFGTLSSQPTFSVW